MTEEKPTEPAKVKFRKLECPFDLQTIFTVAVDMVAPLEIQEHAVLLAVDELIIRLLER